MRPVIAISGDVGDGDAPRVRLKLSYADAVRRAGGLPLVVPPLDEDEARELVGRVDAVVLSGGDDLDLRELGLDLHPACETMHPRRQAGELALARAVLERRVPALGICLGMQVLAVAAGGTLHQHLPDAGFAGLLDHRADHEVELAPGSRLAGLLRSTRPRVVSHHHQAVAELPAGWRASARSTDGVLEAFEATDARFLVGVQWHPERSGDAPETGRLFMALIDAARR
jgi:putative glutamine amidotransferase